MKEKNHIHCKDCNINVFLDSSFEINNPPKWCSRCAIEHMNEEQLKRRLLSMYDIYGVK